MTIILVTTFPMTACNKENADNSVKKITLCEVTHSIFYAPQYVAINNGYFKENHKAEEFFINLIGRSK